MFRNLLLVLLLSLAGGCASSPRSTIPPAAKIPSVEALVTQRGVLTVLGRQFTMNGYLATSARGDQRLIVTETFGGVLADVLVKRDGTVVVMRSSRAFKPEWIRRFVAADLQCVFGNTPREDCPGRQLSATHFVIERRRYRLDLNIVETKPGPQPAELFDETSRPKP